MKQITLLVFTTVLFSFVSCQPSAEEKKAETQRIADSVAKMLTGKDLNAPENQEKIEQVKTDSLEKANAKPADATSLKSISFDYDYDNKLFNKKSDIDGHISNNSGTKSYKNFVFKVSGRDKRGNITESFTRAVNIFLGPKSSSKFTIRFVDSNKTLSATLSLIGATEM